jgi:hypothetical protein
MVLPLGLNANWSVITEEGIVGQRNAMSDKFLSKSRQNWGYGYRPKVPLWPRD